MHRTTYKVKNAVEELRPALSQLISNIIAVGSDTSYKNETDTFSSFDIPLPNGNVKGAFSKRTPYIEIKGKSGDHKIHFEKKLGIFEVHEGTSESFNLINLEIGKYISSGKRKNQIVEEV